MITITDSAAKKIESVVEEARTEEKAADGLRIRVVGGGCSGLQYKIGVDAEKKGDKIFEHLGGRLLVDRRSYLYLADTEVDFAEGLMQSGFQLNNPNVKSTCGCGESFVV